MEVLLGCTSRTIYKIVARANNIKPHLSKPKQEIGTATVNQAVSKTPNFEAVVYNSNMIW